MVVECRCINVYSDMNPWIDFVFIPYTNDFAKAEDIIAKAYNDWWDSEEADYDIPIAEYIGMKLGENGIQYDVYFKSKSEDEE